MSALKELKKLTAILPAPATMEDLTMTRMSYTEMEAERGGPIMLFPLYKTKKVAVLRSFAQAGTELTFHAHEEVETLTIYDGHIEVIFRDNDEAFDLEPGDTLVIPPDTVHRAIWHDNSWLMCITVPAAEGYPEHERRRARE